MNDVDISSLVAVCRSPVERMFLSGFADLDDQIVAVEPGWLIMSAADSAAKYLVAPQIELPTDIGPVVIDFAVLTARERIGVAVEIDGHDWHERTKAQAQRDRRRDRAVLRAGYLPVRFTGSEVWADARACAAEAAEIALLVMAKTSERCSKARAEVIRADEEEDRLP